MRRTALFLTVVGATLLLASGTALAASVQCVPGAASCEGTFQVDTISGTSGRDNIYAKPGDDFVAARGGNDVVSGGSGEDMLVGDEFPLDGGNDSIYGSFDDDDLFALSGSDYLSGGPQEDLINAVDIQGPTAGTDRIDAGTNDDSILAIDGVVDIIDCGGGDDDVAYDKGIDVVAANCEFQSTVPSGSMLEAKMVGWLSVGANRKVPAVGGQRSG